MNPKSTSDIQDIAIDVRNIKKTFKSYKDKASSLKERFVNPSRAGHEKVMVLKGISFQVKRGEAVGLIGKNGCGKSTTLKLLNKILYPNEGTIQMNGRISSLIELGAGFHPDMTGRENIYTNASIFGITHKEVDRRLNDIIRFSELEDYIDNPVRTYSSGMYMRLAFAVAINVDADILLIDEILAVGDSSFQKKCFEKLKEIKTNGATIVIVSHSMDQLYKICDRLIWLENGLVKDEGVPRFIGEKYFAAMEGRRLDRIDFENRQREKEIEDKLRQQQEKELEKKRKREEEEQRLAEIARLEREKKEMAINEAARSLTKFYRPGARRQGTWEVKFDKINLKNQTGEETTVFRINDEIVVEMEYSGRPDTDVNFIIGITRLDGVFCYGSTVRLDCKKMLKSKESGCACFRTKNILIQGKYVLDVRIRAEDESFIDNIYSLIEFESVDDYTADAGVMVMEHTWMVDGKTIPKIREGNKNVT